MKNTSGIFYKNQNNDSVSFEELNDDYQNLVLNTLDETDLIELNKVLNDTVQTLQENFVYEHQLLDISLMDINKLKLNAKILANVINDITTINDVVVDFLIDENLN